MPAATNSEQTTEAREDRSDGDTVLSVDPRTGIEVLGSLRETNDGYVVEPLGPAYPRGAFPADSVEPVSGAGDEPGPEEMRLRKEWDIKCMVMSGALRNLDEDTIDYLSSSISSGHL